MWRGTGARGEGHRAAAAAAAAAAAPASASRDGGVLQRTAQASVDSRHLSGGFAFLIVHDHRREGGSHRRPQGPIFQKMRRARRVQAEGMVYRAVELGLGHADSGERIEISVHGALGVGPPRKGPKVGENDDDSLSHCAIGTDVLEQRTDLSKVVASRMGHDFCGHVRSKHVDRTRRAPPAFAVGGRSLTETAAYFGDPPRSWG